MQENISLQVHTCTATSTTLSKIIPTWCPVNLNNKTLSPPYLSSQEFHQLQNQLLQELQSYLKDQTLHNSPSNEVDQFQSFLRYFIHNLLSNDSHKCLTYRSFSHRLDVQHSGIFGNIKAGFDFFFRC